MFQNILSVMKKKLVGGGTWKFVYKSSSSSLFLPGFLALPLQPSASWNPRRKNPGGSGQGIAGPANEVGVLRNQPIQKLVVKELHCYFWCVCKSSILLDTFFAPALLKILACYFFDSSGIWFLRTCFIWYDQRILFFSSCDRESGRRPKNLIPPSEVALYYTACPKR